MSTNVNDFKLPFILAFLVFFSSHFSVSLFPLCYLFHTFVLLSHALRHKFRLCFLGLSSVIFVLFSCITCYLCVFPSAIGYFPLLHFFLLPLHFLSSAPWGLRVTINNATKLPLETRLKEFVSALKFTARKCSRSNVPLLIMCSYRARLP